MDPELTQTARLASRDLNLLVSLVVLLEEKNVTRAGHAVGVTQPAMSGVLARLRRQFNDELLVRDGSDYHLTPLAKTLLPRAKEALRAAEQALYLEPDFSPETSQAYFSLALSDYAQVVVVKPLVQLIKSIAPRIRLEIQPLPLRLFADPDATLQRTDFVVMPRGLIFPDNKVIHSRTLFRDTLDCLISTNSPAANQQRLDARDLAVFEHVACYPSWSENHITLSQRLLADLGVETAVAVSTASYLAVPLLVAGTDLVGFAPHRLMSHAAHGDVIQIGSPIGEQVFTESVYWHHSRTHDPAHQWFRAILKSLSGELAAAADAPSH